MFETVNELPPSPTAVGITPEETGPATEGDPLAEGVALAKGAAPSSKGESRVGGQVEPGGAAYEAVENILMVGHGDVTVAGPLPLHLSQPSATSAAARVVAEGTGPARESDPLAAHHRKVQL